jgi:hypothetical protein
LLAGRDNRRLLALYVGRMAKEKHLETLHELAQEPGIALTLVGGILFVVFTGYADTDPYHGWVLGYEASTLKQFTNYIFNTSPNSTTAAWGPNAGECGIWMAGNGLCVDSKTNLFFEVGNGPFNADTAGGTEYDETRPHWLRKQAFVMLMRARGGGAHEVGRYGVGLDHVQHARHFAKLPRPEALGPLDHFFEFEHVAFELFDQAVALTFLALTFEEDLEQGAVIPKCAVAAAGETFPNLFANLAVIRHDGADVVQFIRQ